MRHDHGAHDETAVTGRKKVPRQEEIQNAVAQKTEHQDDQGQPFVPKLEMERFFGGLFVCTGVDTGICGVSCGELVFGLIGRWKTEDGSTKRKTEDGRRKTEDGSRK